MAVDDHDNKKRTTQSVETTGLSGAKRRTAAAAATTAQSKSIVGQGKKRETAQSIYINTYLGIPRYVVNE